MTPWPLPGQLVEAGNGMAMILFLAMAISATVYILRHMSRVAHRRAKFDGMQTWRDLLSVVYPEIKAALAIATMCYGLTLRTADVWLLSHIENHGGKPAPALAALATPMLIASTFPIVWGAICWMRTVMPLRCPHWPRLDAALRWAWVVLALAAIGFGVYEAL